jgi:hypothetical protein
LSGSAAPDDCRWRQGADVRDLAAVLGVARLNGVAGQIGLERTPKEFVATMVEVFGLVREVLADDGTLWLNLGDSYAGSSQTGGSGRETITGGKRNQQETMFAHRRGVTSSRHTSAAHGWALT